MIKVEGLNFEYAGTQVLHDVNLHIKPGSITALVGPNGAGKTTLMRCIVGLESAVSGTILVDGIDVGKNPHDVHKRSGYLSDFFGLYDDLTVEQNLNYMARCHEYSGRGLEARVEDVVELVGLEEYLDKPAGSLSRGYRQRLGIGLTLLHEPKILLLDEPASGMDPESRVRFSELILSLRETGYTLLVSSHILAELEDYCTDMLVIRDGRIAEHVYLAEHQKTQKTEITIGVLGLSDEDMAIFETEKDLDNLRREGDDIVVCETDYTPEEQAKLLARLLRKKLKVYQFSPHQTSLQKAYMDLAAQTAQDKETRV